MMLLDKGTDVNSSGGEFVAHCRRLQLKGRRISWEYCLTGADVNRPGGPCSSALQVAVYKGYQKIVETRGLTLILQTEYLAVCCRQLTVARQEKVVAA
jgi:hypothetical protein